MELYNQYLLVYSDEFSDIVYYLTDGTLVCVSAAVVKSPVYIADYHASLSSEYPVKYSTGKTFHEDFGLTPLVIIKAKK